MVEEEKLKSYLSVKDIEKSGIKIDPKWTSLQALKVVASIASLKLKEDHFKIKKKLQLTAESNGFLELEEGQNRSKSAPRTGMADKKGAELREENSIKKSMKEDQGNPRVLPGEGQKLLGDAMTSGGVFYCKELANHHHPPKKKLKGKLNLIDISESLKEHIEKVQNGTDIRRVIHKSLYFTDVSDYHNRLYIPLNQVEQEFLTQEEKELLEHADKLEVLLVEPSLELCKIVLAKWNSSYVLIKEWNNVKDPSKLKEDDEVQIWSFRTPEKLCLALVNLGRS